jgi:4-amino-4-deoxy-L-arabinose transferase-like glycosyltransferase
MQTKTLRVEKIRHHLLPLVLVLGVCVLLFFRGIGDTAFYDKQEAREALVIWEIHNSGNWILPLRNGEEIPAKPPFYHWLGAMLSSVVGRVDELSARLPSALLGTLGVLVTYAVGAVLWGRGAGLVAALVLSTSFEWRAAREARVDMALTFVLLCSFIFFFYLYKTGGGRTKAIILGIFLGLATLAKGPLGFVLPSFTFLTFLCWKRNLTFLKQLKPITVISSCAAVAGSWYLLALWQGGREFLFLVIKENFGTVIGADAGHPHPFWSYVPYLFLGTAPWSLFFPSLAIFLYAEREKLAEQELLYFAIWALTVVIFFSLFSQKRAVYILSAYPSISLLFGAWWYRLTSESARAGFLTRLAGYFNAGSFVVLSALLIFQYTSQTPLSYLASGLGPKDKADLAHVAGLLMQHQTIVLIWAGICGIGGILSILAVRKQAWGRFICCAGALMVVSLTSVRTLSMDLAREYSFKPFMLKVVDIVKDAPLFFYNSEDYSVMFYAGRHIHRLDAQAQSPCYLLIWQNEWESIEQNAGSAVVLLRSESTDRQIPKRGHLLLVDVKNAEALPLAYTAAHRIET